MVLSRRYHRVVATLLGGLLLAGVGAATVVLNDEDGPDDGSYSNESEAGCFMVNLRQLHQMVVLERKYARNHSWMNQASALSMFDRLFVSTATVASRFAELAVAAFGVLLLGYGYRLLAVVLFFSGFVGSAALCYTFTWALFYHFEWFSCAVLAAATLCGGVLGGLLTRTGRTVAFALLGSLTGAVLGYYAYILALGRLVAGAWVLWVAIISPAVLGGAIVLRSKDEALAATSSIIGSCLVVVSLTLMFLPPDASDWWGLSHGLLHPDLKPVADWFHVLGPVVAALFLAARGTRSQLRDQREDDDDPEETTPFLRDVASDGYGAISDGDVVVAAVVSAVHAQAAPSAPMPDV